MVRKIMDDFNVDIRFPCSDAPDPDIVTITGEENAVYDCKEHLLNLQEEYVSCVFILIISMVLMNILKIIYTISFE